MAPSTVPSLAPTVLLSALRGAVTDPGSRVRPATRPGSTAGIDRVQHAGQGEGTLPYRRPAGDPA